MVTQASSSLPRFHHLPSRQRHFIIILNSWPNTTVTRSTTEALCNVQFDDNSWLQAKLPVRHARLGLCTATNLALPAFLSSRAANNSLANDIPHQPTNTPEDNEEDRAWLISTYLPTLTSKEIGTIFSALPPSPLWFPYSTSIV